MNGAADMGGMHGFGPVQVEPNEPVFHGLMTDSGFVGVEMNAMRVQLALPNVSDALRLLQEGAGAYRAVVADLSDEAKAKAWEEVRECLTQFEVGGSFGTELEVAIGSGARPN